MSVGSRHESAYTMLQGTTPKNTRTGVRSDIGSCGNRPSRPPCWVRRTRGSCCTDHSAAQPIREWVRDVFLFPCQARESGFLVAASPVPASPPHGFRGMAGRTANHSTLKPQPDSTRRLMLATQTLSLVMAD